jgi:hypothetical protein
VQKWYGARNMDFRDKGKVILHRELRRDECPGRNTGRAQNAKLEVDLVEGSALSKTENQGLGIMEWSAPLEMEENWLEALV